MIEGAEPCALFAGGDLHFSQGDGEITFCSAIEVGGFIDFHVDLIKGDMETNGVTTNHYNDATLAYDLGWLD